MIAIIVTLTAQPGKSEILRDILAETASLVIANEPGCQQYQVCHSRENPHIFKIFEIYTDQIALDGHRAMPYFGPIGQKLAGVLHAAPEAEFLDALIISKHAPKTGA